LFGLIFGVVAVMDDGIESAIGIHAANNVFLCIMVTNKSSALQTPAVWEQHAIQPWTEFVFMLVMGALTVLILRKIFNWGSFSLLFGKVEAKAETKAEFTENRSAGIH
jgi:cell shape-determining protein MreD